MKTNRSNRTLPGRLAALTGSLATAAGLAVCVCVGARALAAASAPASAPHAGNVNASAHDPKFDDRSIWPEWVTKTDFVKEQWPKGRLLVWAHAGETNRSLDVSEAANWLENGKPAKEPPDENTDIVFPSVAKAYVVTGGNGVTVRHVTVEPGVRVGNKTFAVYGNIWIKERAFFGEIAPRGPRSVFMRNDNDTNVDLMANKVVVNKPKDNSIEFLGKWKTNDELEIFSGKMIVGEDATFMPGDRSIQCVYPDGQLILLSGATFHKRGNQYYDTDLMVEGSLLAGTKDRPLTKDARLGLSFKSQGQGFGNPPRGSKGDRGMMLLNDGKLIVTSADPTKARLVFFWHRMEAQSFKLKETPEIQAMHHGIDMLLLGQVQFDGVRFEDVHKGGIWLPDPAARSQWKNVTFGQNEGKPDELFSKCTGPGPKLRDNDLIRNVKSKQAAAP